MAEPASNLLSDALMGKPADQAGQAEMESLSATSPVSEAPVTPTPVEVAPVMPTAPLEVVPAPTTDSALPAIDTTTTPTLEPTPVSLEPAAVGSTPTLEAASTAPLPDSNLPTAPAPVAKKSAPLGAIGAAVAVIAVVVFGAGAAVVLTQQPQDIRQQAFMGTPAPVEAPGSPDELVVLPTMENSFNSFMQIYPNANSRTLVAGEVVGQLFTATAPEGNQIYFAKFAGLQDSAQSIPMAWFAYDDGTFVLVGTIEMVTTEEGRRGHIVYQDVLESAPQRFIISYEAPLTEELSEYSFPSQRVIDVAL